jgi:hypothetical protein
MLNLRSILTPNMRVKFDYFRDGALWYSTQNGFQFPVPINTLSHTSVCLANDKAERFDYWIKKYYNKTKEEK